VLCALQFGFKSSTCELSQRLDRAECELSVEKEKCLRLKKELMCSQNTAGSEVEHQRHVHVQLAELQVMFVAMSSYYKNSSYRF